MKVHSALGPGLLESAYEACLQYELIKSGFRVERRNHFRSFTSRRNLNAGIESTC
jgi:GxxExxY protein